MSAENGIEVYCTSYEGHAEDCRRYADQNAVLSDDAVTTVVCPYCGERVPFALTAVTGGTLLGYARCREGDEYFAKIQCFRYAENTWKAKRTVYEMSDDFWDIYQQAKNTISEYQSI